MNDSGRGEPASYEHSESSRLNNPQAGQAEAHLGHPGRAETAEWEHDDRTDPFLSWHGKREGRVVEADVRDLHIHERLEPLSVLEAIRADSQPDGQPPLFDREQLIGRESVEFYQHEVGWRNRMIAGDSLLVMTSLLEKEGYGGQVQTIYFDPPYGIKFGGNWQMMTDDLDVKDTKAGITNEPEMVRAFRDTWRKGTHSYLSYIRDRLLLCRELLSDSGSLFLQIGSENVLRMGLLLDEVFGADNRVELITYATSGGGSSSLLPNAANYLLWYAKDKEQVKFRQLYGERTKQDLMEHFGSWIMAEQKDGTTRELTKEEKKNPNTIKDVRLYGRDRLTSQGYITGRSEPYEWAGKAFPCPNSRHWSVSSEGMDRLAELDRLCDKAGKSSQLMRKKYEEEWPGKRLSNIWWKQVRPSDKVYVVQTAVPTIERCILMTSDPGDLVLDPTCGSGTTAYVAEQWGRRWITMDTSRVALTVARKRLLTAVYPYYKLKNDISPGGGFVYEICPKVTSATLAYNENPDAIQLVDRPRQVSGKRRVSGCFTMEALPAPYAPRPVQSLHEPTGPEEPKNGAGGGGGQPPRDRREGLDDWRDWLEQMRRSGVRTIRNGKQHFEQLAEHPGGQWIHAVGVLECGKRLCVVFGSPYEPLSGFQAERAIEEAQALVPRPEIILFAAFMFDPAASQLLAEKDWPGVELMRTVIDGDLLITDLKKAQPGDDVFWLVGQPEVGVSKTGEGEDTWQVRVRGFDYYDHQKNEVTSGSIKNIALWLLDSNYDGRSLFPSQIFFPNAKKLKDGWGKLAKTLGAVVDEDLLDWYHGDVSLPFAAGRHRRAAVKVVDRRGVESMVVLPLPEAGGGQPGP